jgi:23S rRNA-/tRNA-specific pseudouridylate synthase
MAAIGHPVVGDTRYGAPDRRLPSGRFFLHALRLAFVHPVSAIAMEFVSPLPDDLERYLENSDGVLLP